MPTRALHSRQQRSEPSSRHAWLRDTTVWLAISLCIATAMVLVTEVSGAKTPTSSALLAAGKHHHIPTLANRHPLAAIPRSPLTTSTTAPATTFTTLAPRPGVTPPALKATSPHSKAPRVVVPRLPAKSPQPTLAADIAEESWSGDASFPNFVSSSTSFTTSGGLIHANITVSPNTIAVQAVMRCVGASAAATRKIAISLSLSVQRGTCGLEVHLPSSAFHDGVAAHYQVHLSYPSSGLGAS